MRQNLLDSHNNRRQRCTVCSYIYKTDVFCHIVKKQDGSLPQHNTAYAALKEKLTMCATGWSLLPPLLSIALVLFTKEIYFSLCVGILTGALFATGFNPIATMNLIVVDGLSASVAALAGNFCFLVFLGALIHLLTISGGGAAFGRWSEKHIHSRRGVQFATFLLGILIFIDDYFNCLTVGSVMQSVTDRQKISRAKLAYLIDATAVPSVLSCQFHLGRRLFLA